MNMKAVISIILVAVLGMATVAQAVKGDTEAAAAAWPLINEGALVIDVRSEEEFDEGHLDGAVNIPHTEIQRAAESIGSDLDRPVVFYCGSGRRAGLVIYELSNMGYKNLHNATGLEALEATSP
jgi:phage shock protein E